MIWTAPTSSSGGLTSSTRSYVTCSATTKRRTTPLAADFRIPLKVDLIERLKALA